ncbi:hypothetical protein CEP53_015224 [Fusarium sp. AF-6]|nr:hypothetical protein CEP53_015224 [Fusarium sp. AF-6]
MLGCGSQFFLTSLEELKGQVIDLCVWLQWYAFDVIGGMTFQKRFQFLKQRTDVGNMIRDIEGVLLIGAEPPFGILVPDPLRSIIAVSPSYPHLATLLHPSPQALLTNGHGFQKCVSKNPTRRKSIQADQTSWRGYELKLAGSDTTAISLRATFYYLLKNPNTYVKLQQEVDDFDARGEPPDHATYAECL